MLHCARPSANESVQDHRHLRYRNWMIGCAEGYDALFAAAATDQLDGGVTRSMRRFYASVTPVVG